MNMAELNRTSGPEEKAYVKTQSAKWTPGKVCATVLKYAVLIFSAFVMLVPLVVVLFGAFKTNDEFKSTSVLAMPESWFNFDNFVTAFTKGNMLHAFGNTIIVVGVSVVITIFLGTMTAFVINRFKFRFSRIVNTAFLIASLVPSITMQMSVFQIISKLGLFGKTSSLILLYAGTDIISIYIFVQFLENIPVSLDESAIMDGASYFTIYRKILLPLMKPAIVTVLIIKGVGFYNEFYTPFLYTPSPEKAVISTALFKFKGPYGSQWEVICAGALITIIPSLIIFLLLQNQIYSGLTTGAVKE